MEQSQAETIITKLNNLTTAVEGQNGRIERLERWTEIPSGYKGDGTDKASIGLLVRSEMKDALGEFFSLKRLFTAVVIGVPVVKTLVETINALLELAR